MVRRMIDSGFLCPHCALEDLEKWARRNEGELSGFFWLHWQAKLRELNQKYWNKVLEVTTDPTFQEKIKEQVKYFLRLCVAFQDADGNWLYYDPELKMAVRIAMDERFIQEVLLNLGAKTDAQQRKVMEVIKRFAPNVAIHPTHPLYMAVRAQALGLSKIYRGEKMAKTTPTLLRKELIKQLQYRGFCLKGAEEAIQRIV